MIPIAEAGVDHGLPGPGRGCARRSGIWGARLLSSPYRVVAATYWFAAQAIAAALRDPGRRRRDGRRARRRSFRSRSRVAVFHATLAVLGFDVMRWLLRVVLPLSLVFTGVLVALYVTADDPRFAVGRVFHSPDQHLTWARLRRPSSP